MNFICPQCGHKSDYRAAVKDQALLDIIRMQGEFAPHSALVMEYAELFGAVRPVRAAKLLRILTEISVLFRTGSFFVQKRSYRISRPGIAEAMKQVCNRSFTEPLTNHNYLKKVMTTIAEKESVETEKKLREREKELRGRGAGRVDGEDERPRSVKEIARGLPWR